ncbi:hypothetical protein D9M72_627760 [compost metagenome]
MADSFNVQPNGSRLQAFQSPGEKCWTNAARSSFNEGRGELLRGRSLPIGISCKFMNSLRWGPRPAGP